MIGTRDTAPIVRALDERSRALLDRVKKELLRAAPANAAPGTALVGGWAKMGGAIESLLEAVLAFQCAREGRDPRDELRAAFPQLRGGNAGAGQLARVVSDLSHLPAARANEVAVLCRDISGPRSTLRRLIDVRNQVVHEPDALPNHAAAKLALDPVIQTLQTYRRQAGFPG